MAQNEQQTAFVFRCGTVENATKIAGWINANNPEYPIELRALMTEDCMEWNPDTELPEFTIAEAELIPNDNTSIYVSISKGSLLQLACILHYAMHEFPEVPSPQGFTWAEWCSKLRIGEFNGGAVLLTRGQDVDWMSAAGWLDYMLDPSTKEETA